jgi:hypothetical protein
MAPKSAATDAPNPARRERLVYPVRCSRCLLLKQTAAEVRFPEEIRHFSPNILRCSWLLLLAVPGCFYKRQQKNPHKVYKESIGVSPFTPFLLKVSMDLT